MCNAISLLLTGRLSDKFGRRYFLIFAGGLAVVGGIVACTAKTMNTLIGANVSLIPIFLRLHLVTTFD
jgi:MFS family permease